MFGIVNLRPVIVNHKETIVNHGDCPSARQTPADQAMRIVQGSFRTSAEFCEVEFGSDVLAGGRDDFNLRGLGFESVRVEFEPDNGAAQSGGSVAGG